MPLQLEQLNHSERQMADEMTARLGGLALTGNEDPYAALAEKYAREPKEALAVARESLLSIGSDPMLSREEKDRRLDAQLDTVFDLTIKLDHAAFPPTKPGEVREGVPDYIPDGFVDMGKHRSTNPHERFDFGKPLGQILVDKRDTLAKYKPFLKDLLSRDFSRLDPQARKRRLAIETAKEIYVSMQHSVDAAESLGTDVVNLSSISEGVCRHQGLTFQVLCQTLGLKSRVLKSYRDGERHSTNMLRLAGQWYIFDVTNPDYKLNDAGQREWRPGVYSVDEPPKPGETKVYRVNGKFSGDPHTYTAHDNMYWRILDPQEF